MAEKSITKKLGVLSTTLAFVVMLFGLTLCLANLFHFHAYIKPFLALYSTSFRTALAFFFMGLALLSFKYYPKLSLMLAFVVGLISFFVIIEYTAEIKPFIGQAFITAGYAQSTLFAGKMAMITAICFLFISIGVLFFHLSKKIPGFILASGILISATLGLAWVALFTYSAHLELPYSFLQWVFMSAYAFIGVILLGCAMLIRIYIRMEEQSINLSKFYALLVSLIILISTFIFFEKIYVYESKLTHNSLTNHANILKKRLNDQLTLYLTMLDNMAMHWRYQNGIQENLWRGETRNILEHSAFLDAIAVVDGRHNVKWIESKTPDKVIASIRAPAYKTRKNLILVFDKRLGQYDLITSIPLVAKQQGRLYLVSLINLTALFRNLRDYAVKNAYQVVVYENNKIFFQSPGQKIKGYQPAIAKFTLYNATWSLKVYPNKRLTSELETVLPATSLLSGLIFSIVIGLLIITLGKLKENTRLIEISEERNRLLLESAGEGIYGIDSECKTIFVNPAGASMLGYPINELLNEPMHQLIHHSPVDDLSNPIDQCHLCAVFYDKEPLHAFNEVFWKKNGESFPVEYTCTPLWRDGKFSGAVIVFNDITNEKDSQDALQKHAEKMAHINKELDQFAYTVSHDLKSPLRAMINLIDWIEKDSKELLSKKSKEHFDTLKKRAIRMNRLIEDILEYSRTGKTNVAIETVDTNKLLNEIVDSLAPPKHITVLINKRMPIFKTSHVALSQVFSNLISNAIKFMDKPNGRINVDIKETCGYYQFSVKDNGLGIDLKHHKHIFLLFKTLHCSGEGIENTGIGLSIIKKMVESQQGKMWLKSELGKGSTFYFTWPRIPKD